MNLHIICAKCGSKDMMVSGCVNYDDTEKYYPSANFSCTNCYTLTSIEELDGWEEFIGGGYAT